MEEVGGRELFNLLRGGSRIPEPKAKLWFYQMVSAMTVAHKMGVIHRDLKPEHIFINKDRVKIIDWGYSGLLANGPYSTSCGSPHYASPEILQKPPIIGPENDVWALGAILFCMLTGKHLVDASSPKKLFEKIRNLDFDLAGADLPQKVLSLLEKVLVESEKRISCKEILEDPWLSDVKETSTKINGNEDRS